jgi:hypothetical protein
MLVIMGPVLHVIDGVGNGQIGAIAICTFIAALSSLVFISGKELQGAAWWIREVVCLLINVAFALPVTYHVGLWHSVTGMTVMIIIIIMIAFGNHLIEFFFDMRTASQLNRKIRELR